MQPLNGKPQIHCQESVRPIYRMLVERIPEHEVTGPDDETCVVIGPVKRARNSDDQVVGVFAA